MFMYRRSRTNVFFVLSIFAAFSSFIAGQLWFERDSSFVYYMLPTRAGELLIGAICSLVVLRGVEKRLSGTTIKLMASVGLLMVVGSLFLLAEDIVFPGLLAIPPTLGTALLILAGHCTNNPCRKCFLVSQ
ncbi:MAG: hypothetical protein IPL18_14650 [Sphingomonadales bacterium]|nr:hypothetical protein [Sphingomonadales bacterium]